MTPEEATNALIDQVRRANEEALLMSKAFVFGQFQEYWQAKAAEVKRDIEELHGRLTNPDTQ